MANVDANALRLITSAKLDFLQRNQPQDFHERVIATKILKIVDRFTGETANIFICDQWRIQKGRAPPPP